MKSRRFEIPWVRTNYYYKIGLRFGIPLEGPERKDEFFNQLFLINGSSFIYKKRFSKNQKFHFLAKIYELRKKCWETKLFFLKRSTNVPMTIFSYEISFVYQWKILLKIKKSLSKKNYAEYHKNGKEQNW